MRTALAGIGGVVSLIVTLIGTLLWIGYIVEHWCPCQSEQLVVVLLGSLFTVGGIAAIVTCMRETNQ